MCGFYLPHLSVMLNQNLLRLQTSSERTGSLF
jgi:hypothetical protein